MQKAFNNPLLTNRTGLKIITKVISIQGKGFSLEYFQNFGVDWDFFEKCIIVINIIQKLRKNQQRRKKNLSENKS